MRVKKIRLGTREGLHEHKIEMRGVSSRKCKN